jgi:hypothetical protein
MAEDQAALEPPTKENGMDLSHIHPEIRTDLEMRKSQLMKDPDWNYYRPLERQVCDCFHRMSLCFCPKQNESVSFLAPQPIWGTYCGDFAVHSLFSFLVERRWCV